MFSVCVAWQVTYDNVCQDSGVTWSTVLDIAVGDVTVSVWPVSCWSNVEVTRLDITTVTTVILIS